MASTTPAPPTSSPHSEMPEMPAEERKEDDDGALSRLTAGVSVSGSGSGSGGSSSSHNFNSILASLRRANLSMGNRLRSVVSDSRFVAEAARAYGGRPLVANERCGSWYVAPGAKRASAYFKSTDGHHGQWRFSCRRLNLHLVALAGREDGLVVVDSTRRGKRMPDALSKTVPMWCCVVNRVLFGSGGGGGGGGGGGEGGGDDKLPPGAFDLYTPPSAVSASEHAQMLARVPGHVDALRALGLDAELAAARAAVRKPLRPLWVTQESPLPVPAPSGSDDDDEGGDGHHEEGCGGDGGEDARHHGRQPRKGGDVFADFHPIICCTSSRRVVGAEMSEGGYIQGAGDDTENWALGLTPPVFWAHADELLSASDADLPDLVRSIVASSASVPATTPASSSSPSTAATESPGAPRRVAPHLYVSALPLQGDDGDGEQPRRGWAAIIELRPSKPTDPTTWVATTAAAPANESEKPGSKEEAAGAVQRGTGTLPLPPLPPSSPPPPQQQQPRLQASIGKGKIASRNLRAGLGRLCDFARDALLSAAGSQQAPPRSAVPAPPSPPRLDDSSSPHLTAGAGGSDVLVACETGRDLSVGVALALSCALLGGDAGDELALPPPAASKALVRVRLGRIMAAFPEANPSRATLQSVNSFLMG